jgi:hypothetical protein
MPLRDSVSRAVAAGARRGWPEPRRWAPARRPRWPPDRRQPEHARGEHEGPVGVGQGRAHGLHGPPVGRRGGGEVAAEGHLVLERQVDHPVGVGGRLGQAVGVVDVAPLNDGAGRFQRCADASERARPTTSWPAPSSSGTTAEPIQPDAPVTKIS